MTRPPTHACPRRGVILLVVIAALTLFAVVGLCFVLYANAEATASRLQVEAESRQLPDVDPDQLLGYFLGQFLYDATDDDLGVCSALRGHSLARNLYGCNGSPGPRSVAQPAADVVPFNGTGRLPGPSPFAGIDNTRLINFTYYRDDPQLPPSQRFLRDPERLGWRPPDPSAPRGPFAGGCNVPWTYPDLNATFLAAVRADGSVLLPSFHRPWTAAVPSSGLTPDAGEFYDRGTGELNPLWSPNPPVLPPWYKYTTLRPLPALNPGFPPPQDGGGDVKNLMGGPGTLRAVTASGPVYWNNDSFWMDLGYPVLTAPDGRRFKPLFAALVVDLDNRVNVNVHGNARGPGGSHASNQGWGPWEVNLGQVLTGQGEAQNLLLGTASPPQPGRYGGTPGAGVPGVPGDVAPAGTAVHFHSQVDFDGTNEVRGRPSAALRLPGPGALLSCFPSFLDPDGGYGGYGNRSPAERQGHPLVYNIFQPAGGNRVFGPANVEALLRQGDTGSPALSSDLFRLCPASFADPRVRGLVTTHSFDLGCPGVSAWAADPAAYPYEMGPTLDPDQPAVPQGPPIPPPPPADPSWLPGDPRQPAGDRGPIDGRAVTAALGRIDLCRPMPPYPHQGSGKAPPFGPPLTVRGGQPVVDMPFNVDFPNGPIWKQFVLAQAARQRLANDIYRRLLAVAAVAPILPEQDPQEPPAYLLRTRRWLAQLAVNIVDFIDEDDVSTPFCFYTAEDYAGLALPPALPPDPGRVSRPDDLAGEIQWPVYWVFGTELPQVVVNEVLAEMGHNDPNDAYPDTVRVFAELHNSFPRSVPGTADGPDNRPVPLQLTAPSGPYSPYRIVVGVRSPAPPRPEGAAVLPGVDNDNVLGNPDPAVVRQATTDADMAFLGAVPAHGPDVPPLPEGFALLGPPPSAFPAFAVNDPFAAGVPDGTPLVRTSSMTYSRFFTIRGSDDPPDERTEGVAVLLRRLANPYLPFDPRRFVPGVAGPNPTYNPYLTVDYVETVPVYPVGDGLPLPPTSVGKLQPYAAHRSQLAPQTVQPHPTVWHTFGRQNVPAPAAYDWLTHLDRRPSSPLELLQVSGYQPYQLTQRFVCPDATGLPAKFSHRAPWLDEGQGAGGASSRLYRLFEFLEAGTGAAGVAPQGRVPGRVNINTVWDPETLRALCDKQPANSFAAGDADTLFAQFLYDPTGAIPGPSRRTLGFVPGGDDHPFKGFAPGPCPAGSTPGALGGIADSPLRLQPAIGGAHPYLATQLLTKVAGNLTTRSNVFAVWLTVGFFEVTDEMTRPVRLGAELGRAEGSSIRHRMFAVVDRTNLSIASCVAALGQDVPPPAPYPLPLAPATVPVTALEGTLPVNGSGIPWKIEKGTRTIIGAGADQETVEVQATDAGGLVPTITATFTKPHAAGTALSLANVPGAPPVFLKPLATFGPDPGTAPPYVPQPPYPVTVRLAVDPARSSAAALAGQYEGIPWNIAPGTPLIIDVGPAQEVVTVAQDGFAFDPLTATGSFRVVVTRPHADGFTITNTFLGNPGPQANFDPRSPAFSAVVRYVSIIQ